MVETKTTAAGVTKPAAGATKPAAGGVRLFDLLPDTRPPAGNGNHASQWTVHACCCDSRQVRPGDLFVALVGPELDGHDYAKQAADRGAVAILAERPLPLCDVPVFVVHDAREAYGHICQALAGWPSREMHVIGVTGTDGKTTTAALIASVLNVAGGRVGSLSTLGYDDGQTRAAANRTTPSPPLLAQWLGRMTASLCTHAVVEVSSRALAQQRLAGVNLDTACLTNITRAHILDHNRLDTYRRTKARVLDLLKDDGLVVLNADDPVSTRLLSEINGPVLTVGIEGPAEITATVVERSLCEQSFLLHAGDETAAVRTRLLGDHHVYNCLTAAAVGLAQGIDLTTIARGLEAVDRLDGRMERIDCGQDFAVFVDAARTPQALSAAICTLREVTSGRVLCLFGADGETDRDERHRLARAAEQLADMAIVTTTHPLHDPPQWIAADLLDGFESAENASVILDRRQAIEHALAEAAPDDTVLITGWGNATNRRPDDRAIVRETLYRQEIFPFPWRAAA